MPAAALMSNLTILITSGNCEKLLAVTFNRNLKFDYHISDIFKKADWEVSVLGRLTLCMSFNYKKRMQINNPQCNCCLLLWFLHNRKINSLHERFLRIV